MANITETILLRNLVPGASATRIYTGPQRGHAVGTLTICNSGATGTFRIFMGNFAQANTEVATRIAYDPSIGANTTVVWPSRIAIPAQGWLDVYGSSNNIAFAWNYVEVVQT